MSTLARNADTGTKEEAKAHTHAYTHTRRTSQYRGQHENRSPKDGARKQQQKPT